MVQPAFHHQQIAGFAGRMGTAAESMLAGWRGKELIDISSEMTRLTYTIAGQTLFSFNPGPDAETVETANRGDIYAVMNKLHPDVVITWQNSEVCRGHQGVRDFFERMGKKSFKGYKLPPTPDGLTILHGGDTGISFGETIGSFSLLGKEHEIQSRWTAGLVRENGKWLLASYHISMNTLDNPLPDGAKQGLYLAAGLALATGILAGCLIGRRKKA
jgi:ketosteroid isomerase-like protein